MKLRNRVKLWVVCAGFLCAGAGFSWADVTFDLFGDSSLYGVLDDQTGPRSYTNSGIVATFTASDGTMNRTGDGFGLNAVASGDDTDGFDVGEWLDVTFDQAVTLTNVAVSSWNDGADRAVIYVAGVSNGVITATGSHNFSIDVGVSEVLRIRSMEGSVGNGWSLNSLTVVPEPATFALVGIGGAFALLARRRLLS